MSTQFTSFKVVPLSWETQLIGKNVYGIKITSFSRTELIKSELETLLSSFKGQSCLFVVKIESHNHIVSGLLQKLEFRFLECYLEFRHELMNFLPESEPHPEHIIKKFKPDDLPAISQIALTNFTESRLHIDPLIPKDIAHLSRKSWVVNACNGEADHVFVSWLNGNVITGFLVSKNIVQNGMNFAKLDLMAVEQSHRGKGVGKRLVAECLKQAILDKQKHVLVGTQASNSASIRSYVSSGFMLDKCYYSFHKHL